MLESKSHRPAHQGQDGHTPADRQQLSNACRFGRTKGTAQHCSRLRLPACVDPQAGGARRRQCSRVAAHTPCNLAALTYRPCRWWQASQSVGENGVRRGVRCVDACIRAAACGVGPSSLSAHQQQPSWQYCFERRQLTRMPTRWCSGLASTSGCPVRMGTMETPSRVAADGSSRPASSTNVGAKSTLPTCGYDDGAGTCAEQQGEAGVVLEGSSRHIQTPATLKNSPPGRYSRWQQPLVPAVSYAACRVGAVHATSLSADTPNRC